MKRRRSKWQLRKDKLLKLILDFLAADWIGLVEVRFSGKIYHQKSFLKLSDDGV
jgi:hypothetical protein